MRSCHQQTLPEVVFGLARVRGLELDASDLAHLLGAHVGNWNASAEAARQLLEPQPDSANNLGWGLQGLHALGYAPDDLTEAMVRYLLLTQGTDGSWRTYDRRPPIQDGPLVGTALAARGVQLYSIPGREREAHEALVKARHWLAEASPQTHNERVFQLLGLSWTGESPAKLGHFVKTLLADQRADGGWAQLPGRDSDAWATGQALVALHQAGGLATSDVAYQRGIEFLLQTQFDDGSWWVRAALGHFNRTSTASFPTARTSGYRPPARHGPRSLCCSLWNRHASASPFPDRADTDRLHGRALRRARAKLNDAKTDSALKVVDFDRDIRPIFERSCVSCHSGEKPKGGFALHTRELAVKGGQSGEPAIVGGRPDQSPLLRFVQDQVEDLEMPPLSKRAKYPRSQKTRSVPLRVWIAQGTAWPSGTVLHASEK